MLEFHLKKDLKKRKVHLTDKQMLEPQEVFLDNIAQKKTEEEGISDKRLEIPLSKRVFYGISFFSVLFLLILIGRAFSLQIIEESKYHSLAEKNRFRYLSLEANRGIIYDRNLNQLVFNQPTFSLVYKKTSDDPDKENFKDLSELMGIDLSSIEEAIENSDDEEVIIANDITQVKTVILESRIKDFEGFELQKNFIREYKDGELFSHILGYIGKISPEEKKLLSEDYSINDYIGKSGIEKQYESYLRVKPGIIKVEKDVLGKYKSEELVSDSNSGDSLVLWIDSELQKKLSEELNNIVEQIGAEKAAAIAIDPQTGGILSLVNVPSYDNNIFSGKAEPSKIIDLLNAPLDPMFNRVVSGKYPAGSTIKPIIGLAALEEKIVDASKQFFSAGFISIPNPWNPSQPAIYADWKPHGWVDLKRAIAVSSNVYFYTVGGGYENQKGLGSKLMKKYLNFFGWGSKTGIDLPGETEGFIPDPNWKKENLDDDWRVGDDYNMSIGQGYISVSPLQEVVSFAAIANGGRLIEPRIVKEIIDSDGNVIKTIKGKTINQNFVSRKNLEIVRQGMRDAVTYGSAVTLNSLPVTSAAKTGTAQISKQGYYHNWVSVFAPYEDPEIVITIIVEEVEGMRAVSLPVAKEVLEWYFNNK